MSGRCPGAIRLDGAGVSVNGFTIASRNDFDKERVAALLVAAYGGLPPRAVAYLKGALDRRHEGDTALAQTYLALAALPPLADPEEAIWRLSAADELMKAGVSPAVIVEALAPQIIAFERAYDPDQPRVPKGNGRESGQWTSGDWAASDDAGSSDARPADTSAEGTSPTRTADNSSDWARYLNPINSAQAAEATGPPFNGQAPNDQHAAGVEQAIRIYESRGFLIESPRATAVIIPGFSTPRFYDFIVYDPVVNEYAGVEVKTTLYDAITLAPSQVDQDVAVYTTEERSLRCRTSRSHGSDTSPFALGVQFSIYGPPHSL